MAEDVGMDPLVDGGPIGGSTHRSLNDARMDVVPTGPRHVVYA
jgi:hypothetical protein